MATCIGEGQPYNRLESLVDSLIAQNVSLPDMVFMQQFDHFRFVDFARVLSEDLLNGVITLQKQVNRSVQIFMCALEPGAVEYYLRTLGRIGAIAFEDGESGRSVIETLEEPLAGNAANALVYTVDRLVLFPADCGWCLWGDRTSEAGVFGFRNRDHLDQLVRIVGPGTLATIDEAIEGFMRFAFPGWVVPSDFANRLAASYGGISD